MTSIAMKTGIVLAIAGTFAGCFGTVQEDARVRITYEQDSNFYTYKLSEDSLSTFSAGTDGIFVMYRILKIQNTGPDAADFTFSKNKVITVEDSINKETAAGDNVLLGAQYLGTKTVAAGDTAVGPKGLGCIVMRAEVDDPKAMTSSFVSILYEIDTDQPVSMLRHPSDTTVGTVVGPATPELLQRRCQGSY